MNPQRAGRDQIEDAADTGSLASEQAPLKLEKFLPYQLNVVATLVSLALSRVYARRYGIGVPEWRVLVTLGQFGVMTGKAIGDHTHMHKTKVSRAVALMEKRKLLLRRRARHMQVDHVLGPRRQWRLSHRQRVLRRSPCPRSRTLRGRGRS